MEIEISGERVEMLWQKAAWLPLHNTLIAADLHFGKINHFRRAGIPVPSRANDKNTETLIDLLNEKKPERVIFLGDLFHSHYNEEWVVLGQVLKHFSSCSFELVRGNHDIMSHVQYQRHKLVVHEDALSIGGWKLTHEPEDSPVGNSFNLAGHIHPGVRLVGKGRQSMALPCFYFTKTQGILPAFGSFTGMALVSPKKEDRVFVIAERSVREMSRKM